MKRGAGKRPGANWMSETTISVFDTKSLLTLFGARDQHVRKLREALGVSISTRDGQVYIEGPSAAVATATTILEEFQSHANRHGSLMAEDVSRILAAVKEGAHQAMPRTLRSRFSSLAGKFVPKRPARHAISMPSGTTISFFAGDRRERARPIWPSPWLPRH